MCDQDYSMVFLDDGLAKEAQGRYQLRRNKLAKQVGHLVVIMGLEAGPAAGNSWQSLDVPLFQEPHFLFYTGLNQLGCALILDPFSVTGSEILFLPKKNPQKEFWDGPRLGVGMENACGQARSITGISNIVDIAEFGKILAEKIIAQQSNHRDSRVGIFWNEAKKGIPLKDTYWQLFKKVQKKIKYRKVVNVEFVNVAPQIWPQRLVVDVTDKELLRVANKKTMKAFIKLVITMKNLNNETEVLGFLLGKLREESQYGISFPAIVAGGKNASTLHYVKNDDPLIPGQLLLLDFGLWWYAMASDISRTIPINGYFNPLQALLYNIVLDTQSFVEKKVKAGITIRELNTMCWDKMEGLLKERFLAKGGKFTRSYQKAPHGVSHLLGRQIHDGDPFRNYRDLPLQPGWVISNEPGLYGEFELTIDGHQYQESLGIRIEDDLFVTSNGCENLSQGCPKTIVELEQLISKG